MRPRTTGKTFSSSLGIMCLILCLVLAFALRLSWGKTGQEKEIVKKQEGVHPHPLALSPEETIRMILEGYINRDIEKVMTYYPKGEGGNWERWLNRVRETTAYRMTDKKHVKRIVDITLKGIKDDKADKIAYLQAKVETTPNFSGECKLEADGIYVASYQWILRQPKGKGPWHYDGGGF